MMMKYHGFGLLECEVLCENLALADLGIRSDVWLPFMLDLETVQAIKLAVGDEHHDSIQFACAQVLFKGVQECMVINVEFCDMKKLWVAFKSGSLPNIGICDNQVPDRSVSAGKSASDP